MTYESIHKNNFVGINDASISSHIGRFIKHHRINQNKTQEELCADCGIKRSTLTRIESGHCFNIVTLSQLLRALGLLELIMEAFKVDDGEILIQMAKMQGKERKRVRHTH